MSQTLYIYLHISKKIILNIYKIEKKNTFMYEFTIYNTTMYGWTNSLSILKTKLFTLCHTNPLFASPPLKKSSRKTWTIILNANHLITKYSPLMVQTFWIFKCGRLIEKFNKARWVSKIVNLSGALRLQFLVGKNP